MNKTGNSHAVWLYWSPFNGKWHESVFKCKAIFLHPEKEFYYFIGEL